MNIQVRYYTKTGNTKKIAEAIADELGVSAKTTGCPVTEPADILFLGAAVYWAGIDGNVKKFIAGLNPSIVKKVAVFSDSAMSERAYPLIAKALEAKGITVVKENFFCYGKFASMHKDCPTAADLAAARTFAKKLIAV